MTRVPLIGLTALLALACSKEPAPRAATAAEHERIAEREERAAEAITQAAGPHASYQDAPTADSSRQQQAKRHRQLAARHRAAARKIRSAEERACAGVPEQQRDITPLLTRENVTSVTTIEESPSATMEAYGTDSRTTGARIALRPAPALTAEWLQHLVDCTVARVASGWSTPETAQSPLALDDIEADVISTGDGFAVEVTSEDPETVEEIIRRAEALER